MSETARFRSGDRIGDHYRVCEVRAGGMGEVYLCLDDRTDGPVALKTLKSHAFADPAARDLFQNELSMWIELEKHPNIVRCFALEVLDARPYMVLEWITGDDVHGVDLRDWLRHCGALSLRESLNALIGMCRALVHAADRVPGLVHRDLKPENVLVAQGFEVKVTDFGLARLADALDVPEPDALDQIDGRQHLTRMAGTPAYMAPEQWLGQPLDARSDIYALGCIAHELLTGQRPYPQRILPHLRAAHLNGAVPDASTLPDVPGSLASIVERCLQKRANARFDDAKTLQVALEAAYIEIIGEPPRALGPLEQLTAADHIGRGATFRTLQRHDDALAELDAAIRLGGVDGHAYGNRANVLHAMGRFERALEDHARAIALRPHEPDVYCNRAATSRALERYHDAFADLDTTLGLDARSARAHTTRGLLHADLGDTGRAIEELSAAIDLDPASVEAFYNRGTVWSSLGQHERALSDFDRALVLRPDDVLSLFNRGNAKTRMGDHEGAIEDYARYLDLEPDDAEGYRLRGDCHDALEQRDRALVDYERSIKLAPDDARAYNSRGTTLTALGRAEQALSDFHRAIALAPRLKEPYRNRGILFGSLGRYDEALADFEAALAIDPDDAESHLNMGVAHWHRGQPAEALPCFERAEALGDARGRDFAALAGEALGGQPSRRGEEMTLDAVIMSESISASVIAGLLESADFSCDVESETRVRVTAPFHCYLLLGSAKAPRCVRAGVLIGLRDGVGRSDALTLANRINVKVTSLRASLIEGGLALDSHLWLEGGVTGRNLIQWLTGFAQLVGAAFEFDSDNLLA